MAELRQYAQQVAFNPEQAPDYGAAYAKSKAAERANMNIRNQSIANQIEYEFQDNRKQYEILEQLGKFSQKALQFGQDIQTERNKAAFARGMRLAEQGPNRAQAVADYEASSAETQAFDTEYKAEIERTNLSIGDKEQLRSMSPWEQQGYLERTAAMNAQDRILARERALQTDNETRIPLPPGMTNPVTGENFFTPVQARDNPTLLELYLDQDRSEFYRTSMDFIPSEGFMLKNISPLFDRSDASLITAANEQLSTRVRTERANTLFQNFQADQDVNAYLRGSYTELGVGGGAALKTLMSSVQTMIAAGEGSSQIIEDIGATKLDYMGGNKTVAEAFPLEYYAGLSDAENAETAALNADAANRNSFVTQKTLELMEEAERSGIPISQAALDEIKQQYPGYDWSSMEQKILTAEEVTEENAEKKIEAIMAERALTAEDLVGMPTSIRAKYRDRVQGDTTFAGELEGDKTYRKTAVEGAVRGMLQLGTGDVRPNDTRYAVGIRNGENLFNQVYLRSRRNGSDHEQALQKATEELNAQAANGQLEAKFSNETQQDRTNRRVNVENLRKQIKEDPSILTTQVLPGTEAELKKAIIAIEQGEPLPEIYKTLSHNQPFTSMQLARAQAAAAGLEIKVSKREQQAQSIRPEVRSIIDRSPSAGRTYQGFQMSSQTGDTKTMLDLIAKHESETSGGYNAVNQGGSNGGHGIPAGAYSGDFRNMRQHGGRPLTSLTLGEVMDLQYDDRSMTNSQWYAAGKLHAVGRYQFIGGTLRRLVERLRIPRDRLFDAQLQDELAIAKVRERAAAGNVMRGITSEWIGTQYLPKHELDKLVRIASSI